MLPPPQELEGAFMIAFERADDAVEWCLMLQEIMMEVGMLFLGWSLGLWVAWGFCLGRRLGVDCDSG